MCAWHDTDLEGASSLQAVTGAIGGDTEAGRQKGGGNGGRPRLPPDLTGSKAGACTTRNSADCQRFFARRKTPKLTERKRRSEGANAPRMKGHKALQKSRHRNQPFHNILWRLADQRQVGFIGRSQCGSLPPLIRPRAYKRACSVNGFAVLRYVPTPTG